MSDRRKLAEELRGETLARIAAERELEQLRIERDTFKQAAHFHAAKAEQLRGALGGEALRKESEMFMGCATCGAHARWSDAVQGPDHWWKPCGHSGEPVPLESRRIVFRAALAGGER